MVLPVEAVRCFPDGPATGCTRRTPRNWPRVDAVQDAYNASRCAHRERAAFIRGELASATGVMTNAAEFRRATGPNAHHLRRAGYQTCPVGQDGMSLARPACTGFEERP